MSARNSDLYEIITCNDFEELRKELEDIRFSKGGVYRAQLAKYDLQTSFERECGKSGIKSVKDRKELEKHLIRHFRRVYSGPDEQEVRKDTLYCLSLMRHFGAPVRLVDFTYSKYVALYFALEAAYNNIRPNRKPEIAVWCIGIDELEKTVMNYYPHIADDIENRGINDAARTDDKLFQELYMNNKLCTSSMGESIQIASKIAFTARRIHVPREN